MAWNEDPIVEAAPWQSDPIVEEKKRTLPQELARQAGLGVRYGVEGLASIPGIFINPFQQATGAKTMGQATSDLLTRIGLPKEETPNEQLAGAVSRGVAGGGGSAALARGIPAAMNAAPSIVNNVLAQNPLAQTIQSGIGAGASELTRQAGGGPAAQIAAGALTPMAASGIYSGVQAAGRGVRELGRPVTRAGAEQIAADVVGNIALDKKSALANLDEYLSRKAAGQTVGVPGSKPTAGAVTGDYGIIGGEQLASRSPLAAPEFAKQLANNNEQFLNELAKLRATPEQVAAYVARRDEITTPLREQAFAAATGTVDYGPVAEKILQLAKSPEGGREQSRRAIDWLVSRIKTYQNEGRVDPRNADALRMDIGELVAGKISDEKGSVRLAAGLANTIKNTLADQIDAAAPGFRHYLETYSRLSKPIERLEVLADQLGGRNLTRVTNALPVLGEEGASFKLSQAKMRNAVNQLDQNLPVNKNGLPLAPYQRDVLQRVLGELNAQEVASRGGKPPGSDTYQNMATANLLSSVLGKQLSEAGLPQAVSKPLNWMYSPLEGRVRDIINQAYLNPEEMAKLLAKARTSRRSPTWGDIATTAEQNIYGGLLGGATGMFR